MPQYNVKLPTLILSPESVSDADTSQVTLKKDASQEDLEQAKQHVKDQGGEVRSFLPSTCPDRE